MGIHDEAAYYIARQYLDTLRNHPDECTLAAYFALVQYLSQSGDNYEALGTNHREVSGFRRPCALADAKRAVDWLKSHPGSSYAAELTRLISHEYIGLAECGITSAELIRHLTLHLELLERNEPTRLATSAANPSKE
ncbi:hypothetical protein HJC99_05450 [Candidatus Saccharibacteria bacterium]|nr:hypothetical protein [Candidatus Saccharibacteria bacterium]